jgi:hypothetical protein
MVDRLSLVETRSFVEFAEAVDSWPRALAGLELTNGWADRTIAWLSRRPPVASVKSIVFAERRLRPYEALCREAGAVHFIASELELFSLPALVDRYLSTPAFAKLDESDQSLAAKVLDLLPWRP